MDALVRQQGQQVRIIKKVATQISKDSLARKTKEYGEVRLQTINTAWEEIESINTQLEALRDQNPEHNYFTENYYNQIEMLYEQTREHLEAIIREAIERKKNSEEIADQLRLIKKQAAIIEALKRNVLESQEEGSQPQSSIHINQRIKLLNDYWELIVHNHAEIMALGRFKDDYFEKEMFAVTEKMYQGAIIQLQERLRDSSLTTAQPVTAQPTASHMYPNTVDKNTSVKLPRIDIPNFSGDYLKWPSFRNLFMELIHKNINIAKAEKLFYLKANLSAEPSELIQHLNITNENYDTAWEILDRRYNNKRTLVSVQLRTLCNQPELQKESAASLKKLHDTTLECLEAIKNLGIDIKTWDPLLIHLLVQKLDKETRKLYEQSLKNPRDIQTLDGFLGFIENRFQGLEHMEPIKGTQPNKIIDRKNDIKIYHGTVGTSSCTFCKANHKIYACERFSKLNAVQRNEMIRKAKLCSNCLGKGHVANKCKSWRACKVCNKKHHTLLHMTPPIQKIEPNQQRQQNDENSKKNQNVEEISTHMAESKTHNTVLLATAVVLAIGKNDNGIMLRALIDQGAQASFITEDAVQRLKPPKRRINATVTAVGGGKIENVQTCVELTIKPRFSSTFSVTTTALVLKKLTRVMPSERISSRNWEHTKNLVLADPQFDLPGKIDIILGAEVFAKILMNNLLRGPPGSPIAQQTELGWILSGEVQQRTSNIEAQCYVSEVDDLSTTLRKFWDIEELNTEPVMTSEDLMCETHYRTTHKRRSDGRYVVRLPFKKDPETAKLEGSRELALARLLQMERKFRTDKTFASMYRSFMNEYLQLGHMTLASDTTDAAYYLPHHAVLKNDSTTTKLRVVFDGTAKRQNRESLNDILLVGPQIQQNLISILIRWRKHKIVFTADVEKMYRQINIDVRDQGYQRILWRNSPDEPIKEYKLTTVPYGTSSAPFLAVRTLQQLAEDTANVFPLAERVIKRDTYVDDIVSGGDSLQEVQNISKDLINSLKAGGFNLRKWSSNSRELLKGLPWQLKELATELDFDQEQAIKALGVHWVPATDHFKIKVNIEYEQVPATKRELLSEAAKIFDPIGLLAPVTVKIKLLFQEIWSEKLDWDQALPEEIKLRWQRIKADLPNLSKLKIPRWIGYAQDSYTYELHGFSDASKGAYSAAIYFRAITQGTITISLLTAKTKVAPLKSKPSLPRLELCGATLLAKLLKETRESLEIPDLPYFAWTDSKIVLAWIREDPHKWKPFVGHRVAEIQSLTNKEAWHYVKSSDNPADIASRGTYPSQLGKQSLWWEGPYWLKSKEIIYPEKTERDEEEIETVEEERKRITVNTAIFTENTSLINSIIQKHSSLGKIQRILAYCNRYINNLKAAIEERRTNFLTAKEQPENKQEAIPSTSTQEHGQKPGPLTIQELEIALSVIIKCTQETHFKEEYKKLQERQELPKTSRLIPLNPFLDSNNIIRVGGRLENSNMEYEQKHPIIIPHKSDLTTLLVEEAHRKTLHGGNTLTLEVIRQRYWIINGLKAVKSQIHKCVRCHRYKAEMAQQMMGMLPKARVTPSRPFTHTGVDYAGPFELLITTGRGSRTRKGYVAIFICLTTKAIHIEVVTELTSTAFIAAFKRLVSRRGPVAHLYSDNATNFVGASKIISNLYQQEAYQLEINEALKKEGTHWHFIPPSSPHFGGLWEAGVKSMKHHMRRIIGEARITYEEMTTLMTQIEACLNSRPLCPLSEDPENLEVLTPGHFLTGAPILAVPSKDHLDTNPNLLKRWDRVDRMYQDFWRRWSNEYIGRLQQRPKWTQKQPNPMKDDLVLIKEDYLPPSRWALGRIIETHPGSDGLVRVVTLKTKSGTLKRPITKISHLPLIEHKGPQATAIDIPEEIEVDSDTEEDHRLSHITSKSRKRSRGKTVDEESTHANKRSMNEHKRSSHHVRQPNFLGYLFIIATLFVIALAENPKPPYQLTKLTNREGLYFDDISEMRVYFSEWNLVVYYNLSTYWKEYYGIRKAIRKLSLLCDEEIQLPREICHAITQTLNHQIAEIEHMNEILYQQNEHVRSRSRRAPLEIVGTVANKLFGILDQEFADQYEQQINEIKENEKYARQLLKNQTSIVESTVNLMKKNHAAIQNQIAFIENQIEKITTQLNHSQHELLVQQTFNSAAILITLSLFAFQNIQREILSVITDIRMGKINTHLITPMQLNDHLKTIREHLPPNLQVPGTGSSTSLLTLYNSMHVRTRITENNVLFNIKIPLLSTETYRLYEMIPLPVEYGGRHMYIDPSSRYLVINSRRDRFSPIKEEDLQACERLTADVLVCNLNHPIFTLKSNQSHCEVELFNNEQKISPFCKLKTKDAKDRWRRLHRPNTWLFILSEEVRFNVNCGDKVTPLSLSGNGIIQLQGNCTITHKTLFISSNDMTNIMHIPSIPENTALSNLIDTYKDQVNNTSNIAIPQLMREVNNNDLEKLSSAIRHQQQSIDNMPAINIHDLHHYGSTYLVICSIIAIGLYIRCKQQGRINLRTRTRPTPAPRTNVATQQLSPDLPTISLEAGECTQYI